MATYLQGVTDFIPDYQPFQPDLNFYANLLQTKQTQYDTNWNQINNLYGQLYGADLTHDLNIKKKDELLKQIDFNLKRVSGLDLSLEQNVNQATQVFKPFYEDKFLMRDMAYTKNWKNTMSSAEALANSSDPKEIAKWHAEGIRGLEYRRQMFKDATLDETLYMRDAKYVPKVDVLNNYLDFAKKYDIGMVTQTPDGMYLVRKKNGEQLLPGLQQMFWAQYGNNSGMQDYYRELAFVERMDYASQNAEKFGDNKLEAEKDYIKNKYTWLKNVVANNQVKASNENNTAQNLIQNVGSDIASGNVSPQQGSYLERLKQNAQITSEVEKVASEVNSTVNTSVGPSGATEGDADLFNNIELARLKVDAGFASYKAGVDIQNAAGTYAYSNYEVEYKPNAVAIAQFREASANARLDKAHEYKKLENEQAEQLKRITLYQNAMIDGGRAYRLPDGTVELNPQNSGFESIFLGSQEAGQSALGAIQLDELNNKIRQETILDNLKPGVNNMMLYINSLVNNKSGSVLTNQQLGQVLNHFRATDPEIDKMIEQGKNYPDQNKAKQIWSTIYNDYLKGNKDDFVTQHGQTGSMYHLNNYLVDFNKNHANLEISRQYNSSQSTLDMEILSRRDAALSLVTLENTKKIEKKFRENLEFQAKKLGEQGIKVSKEKINGAIDYVMNEYVASGNNWAKMREKAGELDKVITSALGANFIKSTETARDRSFWEYIPGIYAVEGIYDVATGNRQNVASSWIGDILDKSYMELATDANPDKALRSFIVESAPRKTDMIDISSQTQMVKVDSDYAGDFGYQAAAQAIKDALNLPMGDDTQFKFGFGNNIPTVDDEVNYAQDGLDDNIAKSMLRALYASLGKKGTPDFMLGTSRVAMENSKLGSTTFHIPRPIVEEVLKSMEGEFTSQQLAQVQDEIIQKGITVIAPHDYWSHKLWNKSQPTATEIILANDPKGLNYDNPHNAGSYVLRKTNGVPGQDYEAVLKTRIMTKEGLVEEREMIMNPKISGQTIEQIETIMFNTIVEQDKQNQQTYKAFHMNNDVKAMENASIPTNFGALPNSPFWNR
jgi:hypothetical protein